MRTRPPFPPVIATAMGVVVLQGSTVGDLSGEGTRLLSMPQRMVSLVDMQIMSTPSSC
jgi:hypothetical protein